MEKLIKIYVYSVNFILICGCRQFFKVEQVPNSKISELYKFFPSPYIIFYSKKFKQNDFYKKKKKPRRIKFKTYSTF